MSKTSSLLIRIALAFSLLYSAYGFWKHADVWLAYIPEVVKNAMVVTRLGLSGGTLALALFAFHIILALWLLSGWRIFIPSLLVALFLGSIVYFNLNQLDVLFRDVSLALVALALAFAPRNQY